eukprot:13909379-Alexandrium_andersonii.AAC.1
MSTPIRACCSTVTPTRLRRRGGAAARPAGAGRAGPGAGARGPRGGLVAPQGARRQTPAFQGLAADPRGPA